MLSISSLSSAEYRVSSVSHGQLERNPVCVILSHRLDSSSQAFFSTTFKIIKFGPSNVIFLVFLGNMLPQFMVLCVRMLLISKVRGWDLVCWLFSQIWDQPRCYGWWKTTFCGRQPSVEDDLWWKTAFSGEATSKQGKRLRFGMLTVLTNIRSTKVLWKNIQFRPSSKKRAWKILHQQI